jgi:alkanesulfonate monooxygenase SsuD/methylene tetrahydromethanopterin reductase-like flavin-dependent oxidoreductase (luciferase family)
MDVGAYFLPVEFPTYLKSVEAADRAGYTTAWVCDSQMIWQDPYVYMARGLAATERLRFGTAVTNAVTRHYTVTASGHATLADIHPGRVTLGIGRGDSSIRTLGLKPLKIKEMREVIPRLRALTRGDTLDLDGTDIRITWAERELPIMLACSGPRSMALAGELADSVTLELGANPKAIEWAIGNIHAGAEAAGRDPASIRIVALCGMWVSDDLEEARENCRWAPASAANHIAEVLHNNPDCGMPEELTRIDRLRRAAVEPPPGAKAAGVPSLDGTYDYYGGHCVNEADHAHWITDELLDDFTLAGTAESVLDRIADLAAVGVDEVASAFLNGAYEQMARVGDSVIPKLGAITSVKR